MHPTPPRADAAQPSEIGKADSVVVQYEPVDVKRAADVLRGHAEALQRALEELEDAKFVSQELLESEVRF